MYIIDILYFESFFKTFMETLGHDTNFLALLDQRRHFVFNGKWRVSSGKRKYSTGGADVFYSGIHAKTETIWIPGRLKKAVEIRVSISNQIQYKTGIFMKSNLK